MLQNDIRSFFGVAGAAVALAFGCFGAGQSWAATGSEQSARPSLVITNDSFNADGTLSSGIYNKPVRTRDITASEVLGNSYFNATNTIVREKINDLRGDLGGLQSRIGTLASQLRALQERNIDLSSEYNASVATINTQLQSGTTPGNPRLVQKLGIAQQNLDRIAQNVADLNGMAVAAANAASMGSYLLEATRSAYGLSGAVEEDHVELAKLEDQVNNTIVGIDRVLNEINDDITRTAAYLSSERSNLRVMSLAVTNGDYYGRSLSNRPFSSAPTVGSVQPASLPRANGGVLPGARPLVKIQFDQPNVQYQQAVYMAVNEAMQRFPNARLNLVAVYPSLGNSAQIAIESTRSRRNAETVLRSMSQMGIDVNKVDISTMQSADAKTNEVHIYIR